MRNKYKPTGCLKFLIFMIIFLPIAFFGAHLIQGKDWRDTIQEFTGERTETTTRSTEPRNTKSVNSSGLDGQIENLENIIKAKDRRIKELEKRVSELENQ